LASFAWFVQHAELVGRLDPRAACPCRISSSQGFAAVVLTYVVPRLALAVSAAAHRAHALSHLFPTTVIGFAALGVLPARAGDVLRPYLLAKQERLSAPCRIRDDRHGAGPRPDAVVGLLIYYVWGVAPPEGTPGQSDAPD
jgi:hypothetical protein